MEHLNRTLKDYLLGHGANIGEATIVQTSKSLCALMNNSAHYDSISGIHKDSIYHTSTDSSTDLDLVVNELQKSYVFEYIPGRVHRTFEGIKAHVTAHIDSAKLFTWMRGHQKKISNHILRNIFHT